MHKDNAHVSRNAVGGLKLAVLLYCVLAARDAGKNLSHSGKDSGQRELGDITELWKTSVLDRFVSDKRP